MAGERTRNQYDGATAAEVLRRDPTVLRDWRVRVEVTAKAVNAEFNRINQMRKRQAAADLADPGATTTATQGGVLQEDAAEEGDSDVADEEVVPAIPCADSNACRWPKLYRRAGSARQRRRRPSQRVPARGRGGPGRPTTMRGTVVSIWVSPMVDRCELVPTRRTKSAPASPTCSCTTCR